MLYPYATLGAEAGDWESGLPQELILTTPNGLPGIPVSSGGNYTDETGQQWVCDKVDFGRGVYVQRVFEIDLARDLRQGSLVTHSDPHPYEGISRFVYRNPAELKPATRMLCNRFPFSQWAKDGELLIPHGTAPQINIQIKTERLNTDDLAGLTSYALSNPVRIMMELATPVETLLSDTIFQAYASLRACFPNTVLTNDSGAGMEVCYLADTKRYVDQKFDQLAAALVASI